VFIRNFFSPPLLFSSSFLPFFFFFPPPHHNDDKVEALLNFLDGCDSFLPLPSSFFFPPLLFSPLDPLSLFPFLLRQRRKLKKSLTKDQDSIFFFPSPPFKLIPFPSPFFLLLSLRVKERGRNMNSERTAICILSSLLLSLPSFSFLLSPLPEIFFFFLSSPSPPPSRNSWALSIYLSLFFSLLFFPSFLSFLPPRRHTKYIYL